MKNIHVLPTEKPQNIYITSNEEIKEGWHFNNAIGVNKPVYVKDEDVEPLKNIYGNPYYLQKIILTTDQDLIKDGVQAIDDEFIEWFVKNPSCEYVDIDKINLCTQTGLPCGMQCLSKETCNENISYKIIIPKEEPKQETLENIFNWKPIYANSYKQETLEEFKKRFSNDKSNKDINLDYQDGIFYGIEIGSKWQQEQDKNKYSEEDISIAIAMYLENKSFSEIIKQFKNK